jgi:hypothetical protein
MTHANENEFGSERLAINLEVTSLVIFQDLSEVLQYPVPLLLEALRCTPEVAGSIPEEVIETVHVV